MTRVLALSREKEIFTDVRTRMREKPKFELRTYSDTVNLIENFISFHTQLVILDLDLLDRQILKLINVLRVINKEVKIILVLSQDKMSVCSKAVSLGVISYLIKPVSSTNLSKLILSTLTPKNLN